jgi:Family of unknown function (DUF5906)
MTTAPLSQKNSTGLSELVKFFDLTLPSTGYRVLQGKRKTFLTPQFYATNAELAAASLSADAAGMTVYHAVASYREALPNPTKKEHPQHSKLGRCGPNVLLLKALIFEIDVHPAGRKSGKPCYRSTEEAIGAVSKFCATVNIPAPLLVASSWVLGENPQASGLHGYLPLDQELMPEQWRLYAIGLSELFARHGLLVDPPRTSDVASILRPLGSTNRKEDRTGVVQIIRQAGPYRLDQFAPLFEAGKVESSRWRSIKRESTLPFLRGGLPAYLLRTKPSHIVEAMAIVYEPASALLIVEKCGQVKRLRDWRMFKELPEPAWYAVLGVLAFAEGGDECAHAWSDGHHAYVQDQTQERLDRQRAKLTGATTCNRFHQLEPKICEACPHWQKIKSPIALGQQRAEPAAEPAAAAFAGVPGAPPAVPVESCIMEINKRHFMIRNVGGKCRIGEMRPNPIGGGQMLSLQSVDDFKTWLSNCYVSVRGTDGSVKQKPLGDYWIKHAQRRQYESVDLVPNAPKELPNGNLNLWRGFGVEPRPGDWSRMRWHIGSILAGGDPKAAEYILCWVAWSLQHPGEPAEVALVLQGGKGSGKGVFGKAIARCFGEHGLHIFHQSHLTGNFNGHLRSCLFLFADEAFWAGDKKGESVLKGLITERSLVIEQKGIDPIQWPNRLHVLMAANAEWVVPASHDERRFAVFNVSNRYAQGEAPDEERRAYFEALHGELDNGGVEAMLFDMRSWQLGSWHPRQIYQTEGLRKQKEQSLTPLEEWLLGLLQEGRLPGSRPGKSAFSTTRALVEDAKQRVPRLRDYISDQKLVNFLKNWGCISHKDRGVPIEVRGWIFLPLAQLRAMWERRYGGWEWENPELEEWQ